MFHVSRELRLGTRETFGPLKTPFPALMLEPYPPLC